AMYSYEPGMGFATRNGIPAREVFAKAEIDKRMAPDFSKEAIRTTFGEHPLFGIVKTEVYADDNNGILGWHISTDESGRVWVSGLTNTYKKHNSYGTDDEVISLGVYDNKPAEYDSQIEGLVEGVDYKRINNTYVDITPLLDNLPLIKQYRQAKGV